MSERILNVSHDDDSKLWYNGRKYRSKLEIATAEVLDDLGIPFEYETKKIELLEGFHSPFQKDKVRAISYTPDFMIGPIMIECKGFETPEWKIKKKLVFKYLQENEPEICFYQIHDAGKQLLMALDNHWTYLGYAIKVTSKGTKKSPSFSKLYDSVQEAMSDLHISGKPMRAILKSLCGDKDYVYGYKWELIKLKL